MPNLEKVVTEVIRELRLPDTPFAGKPTYDALADKLQDALDRLEKPKHQKQG